MADDPDVLLLAEPVEPVDLRRLVETTFGDMVKLVVDVERQLVALGGQLHADAEQVLLENGSRQASLWGANYLPGRSSEECIEFTSLINIRPGQGNRSMEVQDEELRAKMRELIFRLVGTGEDI